MVRGGGVQTLWVHRLWLGLLLLAGRPSSGGANIAGDSFTDLTRWGRPKCSAVVVANIKGVNVSRLTDELFPGLPNTKVVKTADPLTDLQHWLYDQRHLDATPHMVFEQQGEIMHGFLDVVVPLAPGLRAMAASRGCTLVLFTMLREPAANYITAYNEVVQKGDYGKANNLVEWARAHPELQLVALTRLVDPLLKLHASPPCDKHAGDAQCVFDAPDAHRGLLHAIDYAVNQRLNLLTVVGVQELYKETVLALDAALGLNGLLNGLEQQRMKRTAAFRAAALPRALGMNAEADANCQGTEVTIPIVQSSLGQMVQPEDLCLYNGVSLFEILQLRKMAPASIRVFNKWRDHLALLTSEPLAGNALAPATVQPALNYSTAAHTDLATQVKLLTAPPRFVQGTRDRRHRRRHARRLQQS